MRTLRTRTIPAKKYLAECLCCGTVIQYTEVEMSDMSNVYHIPPIGNYDVPIGSCDVCYMKDSVRYLKEGSVEYKDLMRELAEENRQIKE